ncbi:MAG: glycoside hydrolase family 31 protein [Prevotella sp.]|nr:glycoside hydrolase family 31 protein [Prevotella sp.]
MLALLASIVPLSGEASLALRASAEGASSPLIYDSPDSSPVAFPEAVVTSGRARFTVLTSRMIRIQYSSASRFEDRATFAVINRRLPVPDFTVEEEGSYLVIKTHDLTLRYRKNAPLSATSKSSAALSITFSMNGEQVQWYPGKEDAQNLKGTTRTLDGNLGDAKRRELENGILSRSGWAVIDESPATRRGDGSTTLVFDKAVDGIPWVAQPVDRAAVDWYFMGYGHEYKQALTDYTKIAGRQPMPPLYVLGYWYSRYWRYTQRDYVNLVSEIQQNQIPMDVMIFDKDWHTDGWTGWTWDKSIITNPPALINWMHNRNLHVSLNLHPADGVDSDEENFSLLRQDMGLGADATVVPWHLEDSTFYKAMFKDIIRNRERDGVDFWWIDWQQNLVNPRQLGLSETFWCNHVFYNDMRLHRPDRRPVIFHRWGGLGSHRYPIGFSGDAVIDYSTLSFEVYFTSTASNVCFGYWGHDLGGHQRGGSIDNPNDPELYLRWMQYGVFTPVFRSHATNDGSIERRIWKYSNFGLLNDAVRLRYAMMPYIYTAARQAYDTGVSICRPLYYDSPEEEDAYRHEDEYMFGNDILVSPVTVPGGDDGLAHRSTWLPKGQWFNVCRNRLQAGGMEVADGYADEEIPYFYRAGAVIPQYSGVYNLVQRPETLTLKVVPGEEEGKGELYEDENDTEGYKTGAYTRTSFVQRRSDSQLVLTISPAEGSFPGMPGKRDYVIEFLGEEEEPRSVSADGVRLVKGADWTYDAGLHLLRVKLTSVTAASGATVTVGRVTTGIRELTPESSYARPVYWNLAGQRVSGKARGIIVRKGSKLIVR